MKRKIVKQGAATLMISLPSDYVKRFGLKKGQEINVLDVKNSLLITTSEQNDRKEIHFSFASVSESAIRLTLINAYRAGYDIITISNSNPTQKVIIQEVLQNYLLGLEITKDDEHSCVLENVTEPNKENFETLFQKLFSNIHLMIEGTEKHLKDNTAFDYRSLMFNIQRYDNFCRRIITKQNVYSERAVFLWNYLSILIHSPRELYHLNKYLHSASPDTQEENKTIAILLSTLKVIAALIREAYHHKDIKIIEEIHHNVNKILSAEVYPALEKQENNVAIHHLSNAIRHLHLSTSPLIGLFLTRSENHN